VLERALLELALDEREERRRPVCRHLAVPVRERGRGFRGVALVLLAAAGERAHELARPERDVVGLETSERLGRPVLSLLELGADPLDAVGRVEHFGEPRRALDRERAVGGGDLSRFGIEQERVLRRGQETVPTHVAPPRGRREAAVPAEARGTAAERR